MTLKPPTVPIEKFGRDHWSTFGYIETRIVDHGGEPDCRHMRTDVLRHAALARAAPGTFAPTRLAHNETLASHDDWDCLEDAETAGLLVSEGTGLYPRYRLTSLGLHIASKLREHKARGHSFADFHVRVDPIQNGVCVTYTLPDRGAEQIQEQMHVVPTP